MIHPRRFVRSVGHASSGIYFVFLHDQNIRIHTLVAVVAILLGIFFQISSFEMGLLIITIFFVLVAEMLNSAVENVVNLITTEHNINAKIAKDISAGMVMVAAIGSLIVGAFIFFPHVLKGF